MMRLSSLVEITLIASVFAACGCSKTDSSSSTTTVTPMPAESPTANVMTPPPLGPPPP